jgi:phosphatidylserine/phosphatidylglycerophosphate/cardiolipin synthase-like enzyme
VVEEGLLAARSHVWIATADLKDMHVRRGRRYRPILELFDEMAQRGVSFRVVHAALPSRPFRETLESYPRLTSGALELQICPRSHWKMLIVDHAFAYLGSANFTGAGLGARSERRRNLEIGIATRDPAWIAELAETFDRFWIGEHCDDCALRDRCPDPVR